MSGNQPISGRGAVIEDIGKTYARENIPVGATFVYSKSPNGKVYLNLGTFKTDRDNVHISLRHIAEEDRAVFSCRPWAKAYGAECTILGAFMFVCEPINDDIINMKGSIGSLATHSYFGNIISHPDHKDSNGFLHSFVTLGESPMERLHHNFKGHLALRLTTDGEKGDIPSILELAPNSVVMHRGWARIHFIGKEEHEHGI